MKDSKLEQEANKRIKLIPAKLSQNIHLESHIMRNKLSKIA